MFDISGLTGSFKGMSEERRRVLADFFKARNAYMEKATELNDRRISALLDPTPEREQAVKDFASTVVVPLRTQATVQAVADKIAQGLDKAAAEADKRTQGKHSDKIAKAKAAAKDGLDKLDGKKGDDLP